MSYTNGLDKPSDYFSAKLYTGTGSQLAVTGVGFQPDWIWFKNRGTTNSHGLQDVVRGFNTTGIQSTNGTDADPAFNGSTLGYVSAVGSDGFTVEAGNCANASSNTYVAWNWKETATAGFDIVSYTGNGSNRTISHSLSAVPSVIIIKDRDGVSSWIFGHKSLGFTKNLFLQTTEAAYTSSNIFNNTSPTSSVFSVGTSGHVNDNGHDYISYLFSEKKGYSKFGSYTGNGNSDGTFVYTGFKPAWLLAKKSSGTADWFLIDNKRSTINPTNHQLEANSSAAEDASGRFDFLSNGFKCVSSSTGSNGSGTEYIFMAFAENPFATSTGIPTTAR